MCYQKGNAAPYTHTTSRCGAGQKRVGKKIGRTTEVQLKGINALLERNVGIVQLNVHVIE